MKTTKEFRKRMVIAVVVLICGVALMGLIYIANNKPFIYISPGIVTSAPTMGVPTIESVRMNRTLRPYVPSHTVSYTQQTHPMFGLTLPMQGMRGIHETSRARMQSIGGGNSGGSGMSTGSRGRSSRGSGVQYGGGGSVAMPMTSFIAMADTRQVAKPAAKEAPQMARLAVAPMHAPGPPNVTPPDEHQLVEQQPIGDGVWMLLLMAVGYVIAKQMTRQKAGHLSYVGMFRSGKWRL